MTKIITINAYTHAKDTRHCCLPVSTEHEAVAAKLSFYHLSSISTCTYEKVSRLLLHLWVVHSFLIALAVGEVTDEFRVAVAPEPMMPLCLAASQY